MLLTNHMTGNEGDVCMLVGLVMMHINHDIDNSRCCVFSLVHVWLIPKCVGDCFPGTISIMSMGRWLCLVYATVWVMFAMVGSLGIFYDWVVLPLCCQNFQRLTYGLWLWMFGLIVAEKFWIMVTIIWWFGGSWAWELAQPSCSRPEVVGGGSSQPCLSSQLVIVYRLLWPNDWSNATKQVIVIADWIVRD